VVRVAQRVQDVGRRRVVDVVVTRDDHGVRADQRVRAAVAVTVKPALGTGPVGRPRRSPSGSADRPRRSGVAIPN